MTYRDVRRLLKKMGYAVVRTSGSHEQWFHPQRTGAVAVAGRNAEHVPQGIVKSIMRQIRAGESR